MVLLEYARLAFSSIMDIIDPETGDLLPTADGRLIESLTITLTSVGKRVTVKLRPKEKAPEVLARYTGLGDEDQGKGSELSEEWVQFFDEMFNVTEEERQPRR